MADCRAIMAVCDSIVRVLRTQPRTSVTDPNFAVELFQRSSFANALTFGLSITTYRVKVNGVMRHPVRPAGSPRTSRLPPVPVDVHLILAAWAQTASMQHQILGWGIRALADRAVLTPDVLNVEAPDCFDAAESVDVAFDEVNNEDLFQLWDRLGSHTYQLCVPLVARGIRIDSDEPPEIHGGPVQVRVFDSQPHARPVGTGVTP